MRKTVILLLLAFGCSICIAQGQNGEVSTTASEELNPWCGKYCISIFTKTRSAKIVPENRWLLSLKYQNIENDQKWSKSTRGTYHHIPSGEWKDMQKYVFCAKYGLNKNHQIAIGVPFTSNNFNYGTVRNKSAGVGNIYIFEKWNFLKETNTLPAMAVDFWYYFPNGDPDRMLGTDDDAYKVTAEVSKAWKDFSIHFNPGYKWDKKAGNNNESEINAAVLLTPHEKLWPAIEYNYYYKQGSGHSHDIVPGLIWKFRKDASFKIGVVINLDSTITYRDRAGLILKVCQYF